ncbi:phage portal protein [Pelistega ratti]|uniref:phage portal protein n=1 Tax=Pelistega ratti TaxID=2652177 RepID=UPI0013567648|nr:phage portal protein [Pelistega ratti]
MGVNLLNTVKSFFAKAEEEKSPIEQRGTSGLEAFIRGKSSGDALNNMALLRCVLLISESLGMLPLNLMRQGEEKALAKDHPLYLLLKKCPNTWQTAYEFKRQMQLNVLFYGNAYAYILRTGKRITGLVPLMSKSVTVKQKTDFTLEYRYTNEKGHTSVLNQSDVLHLKDISFDGIKGLSRVKMAFRVLNIAESAEQAIERYFTDGVMARGAITTEGELSDRSYEHLKESLAAYSGPQGNNKFMLLEQGLKPVLFGNSAADAQHIENRKHQIEEVARAFGVPRPLLMMDDTSWGSGIEQLGMYFVQYTLQPWFTAWEQAIERCLLQNEEGLYVKFNERALLRGTLKDQADFFAKALGAGGHGAWYTQNEIRELQDMKPIKDTLADTLKPAAGVSVKESKEQEDELN